LVLPSISVNRNVTVPDGKSVLMGLIDRYKKLKPT
jgi:hypothetical protein